MTELGFQLYSARNFQPFSNILKKLSAAGYKQVEGYGAMYASLDDAGLNSLRSELDANGLAMPTGHFGLDLLEGDPKKALNIAKVLGVEAIYCPYLMPDQRPADAAGWFAFGKRLQEAGKPFVDAGLTFGWHNHDFEFRATDSGKLPMDIILETAPLNDWEMDVAWVVKGGQDPLDWIKKYGARINAVHVKDIAPAGEATNEDGWADVGHGTLDWQALQTAIKAQTNAQYWVMEHDNPSDDARFAQRSFAAVSAWK